MMHGWELWHGGWWMWIGMILFWGAIILLFIWGVRTVSSDARRDTSPAAPEDDALEIARKRYARGELSRDEYQALVRDLNDPER